MLGIEPPKRKVPAKKAGIRKRLPRVEALPAAAQRAVLKSVDALVQSRGIVDGSLARIPASQNKGFRDA